MVSVELNAFGSQRMGKDHNIVVLMKDAQTVQCCQNTGGSAILTCRNVEGRRGFLCISSVK